MTHDMRPERRAFLAKTSAIAAAQTFSALPLDAAFAASVRLTGLSAVEAVAAMRAGRSMRRRTVPISMTAPRLIACTLRSRVPVHFRLDP
jgi:hypothetical protein